jgi:urease accessory protein
MRIARWILGLILLLAVLPSMVIAHPGHGTPTTDDLAAGFTHPLLGPDHLIAMVAIGLWAAQIGGRAMLLLPAVFVSMMLAGGAAAMGGWEVPALEPAIVASVLVLGLVIAAAANLPLWVGVIITAAFAFVHGAAHGSELHGASPALFALGALTASALLHAAGAALGLTMISKRGALPVRIAGGAIAALGLLMAIGVL